MPPIMSAIAKCQFAEAVVMLALTSEITGAARLHRAASVLMEMLGGFEFEGIGQSLFQFVSFGR